jgi:hypothetical protein
MDGLESEVVDRVENGGGEGESEVEAERENEERVEGKLGWRHRWLESVLGGFGFRGERWEGGLFRVLGEESERGVEINESFFCTRHFFTNGTHDDVANFNVQWRLL